LLRIHGRGLLHIYRFFAEIQLLLSRSVELRHLHLSPGAMVCALVASYRNSEVKVGAAVFELPRMEVLEELSFSGHTPFPYVPGLFYLREGSFATEALRRLSVAPDLALVEGHGIAHPRRAGLASIVGLVNVRSIGDRRLRFCSRASPSSPSSLFGSSSTVNGGVQVTSSSSSGLGRRRSC
jgi:deoxyinosine 3'endonuclease (endonuclease V)